MNPKARLAAVIGAGVVSIVWPLVAVYEGKVNRGYRDPIGIVTACRGHTQFAQLGRTYTDRECDELAAADLWRIDADIGACIKVPLADGPRAAFLSFSYNVGPDAFCQSTLARKLNAGDLVGACNELPKWVYAGGRALPGLVKRREAERAVCLEGAAL